MFLFAALVPPREVLEDFWSVVPPPDDGVASIESVEIGRHARPRLTRLGRRRRATVEYVPEPPPLIDITPVPHAHLLLAKFGNLVLNDANRLVGALTEAAAEWPSPRLKLHGFTTVESESGPTIWVDVQGDVDDLWTIARGLPRAAQGLRLFVDRRAFQPRIRLGSVNPAASLALLETVLAGLEDFETNAWWQTSFDLYTHAPPLGPHEPPFKPYATIPLGPHVSH